MTEMVKAECKLDDGTVEKLEAKGFSRWTKNGMDRLYINATRLGLELEYYNTGNIKYAELNGERISNRKGGELKATKNYIDLVKGIAYAGCDEFLAEMMKLIKGE